MKVFRQLGFVLALAVLTVCSLPGQAPAIRNFGEVEPGTIYRSAQPTDAELSGLARMGIKTVLDLRDDATVAHERTVVENSLHLHFLSFPLKGVGAPTDAQIQQILAAIDAAPKPVLIHCHQGEDRTGVVVAVLRMTHDHWTRQQAFSEAEKYHISKLQWGMRAYIKRFQP
jgi:protein tyrosine/serine phosphatase